MAEKTMDETDLKQVQGGANVHPKDLNRESGAGSTVAAEESDFGIDVGEATGGGTKPQGVLP